MSNETTAFEDARVAARAAKLDLNKKKGETIRAIRALEEAEIAERAASARLRDACDRLIRLATDDPVA